MVLGFIIIASLLAVAYAAFTTGVLCASNRELRLVFVRVMALLGLVALGGACVSVLRAETPVVHEDAGGAVDNATAQAAEIVVEAFGQVDDKFVERYTNLDELLTVGDQEVPTPVVAETATVDEGDSSEGDFPDESVVFECGSVPEPFELASIKTATVPDWVGQPSFFSGTGEHWVAVRTDPKLTDVEAQTELQDVVQTAVADYVDDQVGHRGAADKIHISFVDIDRYQVIRDRYADEYDSSMGPMQRKHAKLVFTPAFRSMIAERWQEHLVSQRLVRTAVGVVTVMGALFVLLGIFKRLGSSVR